MQMSEYVALVIRGPDCAPLLSSRAAAALVALARRRWGKRRWRLMEVDAFSGGETLLFVRPRGGAAIADYALPFLAKYIKK
jgi:hypothetical protein